MWNPDSYRDTDYGLDADETFAPADDLDEEFVPAAGESYIMTVLGPIPPDDAGVTLVGEHLQWRPADAGDGDATLNDPAATLGDLESFFTVSGRTVVSATPAGAGRDARALRWLAQHAPVHIVGATGFAHSSSSSPADVNRLRREVEQDLTIGMDGTTARAGVLIAGSRPRAEARSTTGMIAAVAELHDRFDVPVMTAGAGDEVAGLVEAMLGAGLPAGRIIAAHAGAVPGKELARLADAGVYLLFDRLGADGPAADLEQARLVARLTGEGSADRILLSHGYDRRSQLIGYGGRPGLSYIVEQFAVMLLEEGLEALDVRRMLIDNAIAALSSGTDGSGAKSSHREEEA